MGRRITAIEVQDRTIYRYDPTKTGLERWLSPLRTSIMEFLWEEGRPCTVRQVMRGITSKRALTTIQTVLNYMVKSGLTRRTSRDHAMRYEPVDSSREAFIARQLASIYESLKEDE